MTEHTGNVEDEHESIKASVEATDLVQMADGLSISERNPHSCNSVELKVREGQPSVQARYIAAVEESSFDVDFSHEHELLKSYVESNGSVDACADSSSADPEPLKR